MLSTNRFHHRLWSHIQWMTGKPKHSHTRTHVCMHAWIETLWFQNELHTYYCTQWPFERSLHAPVARTSHSLGHVTSSPFIWTEKSGLWEKHFIVCTNNKESISIQLLQPLIRHNNIWNGARWCDHSLSLPLFTRTKGNICLNYLLFCNRISISSLAGS